MLSNVNARVSFLFPLCLSWIDLGLLVQLTSALKVHCYLLIGEFLGNASTFEFGVQFADSSFIRGEFACDCAVLRAT